MKRGNHFFLKPLAKKRNRFPAKLEIFRVAALLFSVYSLFGNKPFNPTISTLALSL